MKTAEIIIDKDLLDTNNCRFAANNLFFIRIDCDEMRLNKVVKAAGG